MKRIIFCVIACLSILLPLQVVTAKSNSHRANVIGKGYRGMVELQGVAMPVDGGPSNYGALFTYHGYQVVPQFFVGAGVGVVADGFSAGDMLMAVRLRSDILDRKITPFVEADLGGRVYNGSDSYGGRPRYFSAYGGCRFRIYNKLGVNVGLGYSFYHFGGVGLKVGIDF